MDEFTNPTPEGVAGTGSGEVAIGDSGASSEPVGAIADNGGQAVGATTAQESTPSIPSGYIPEENLRKLQSQYDRQIAEQKKQAESFKIQYEQAEAQRQEYERLNAEYQQRIWQQHLAALPLEQQAEETYKYQLWQQQQDVQRQIAERDRYWQAQVEDSKRQLEERNQRDAQLEPVFKELMIERLSVQKGIPKQYLEYAASKYNNPETIAAVAEVLALEKQARRNTQRQEERVDSSEGEGRGSTNFNIDPYRDSGNLAEFYKARRRAGQ